MYDDHRKTPNDEDENDMTVSEEETSSEPDVRSKRQRRLANISNPGANDKSKGDAIGESNGSMIWWNGDGDAEDGTRGTWGESEIPFSNKNQLTNE